MTAMDSHPVLSRCQDVRTLMEVTPEQDCLVLDARSFHVPSGELARHCADLYEAAGLPAPVILNRPGPRAILVDDGRGEECVSITPSPGGSGNVPGVTLAVRYPHGIRLTGEEPLRVALALVDAMREPGDEPDPAEVEELAQLLREVGDCASLRWDAARAVLRWMRDKQQRGETSDG